MFPMTRPNNGRAFVSQATLFLGKHSHIPLVFGVVAWGWILDDSPREFGYNGRLDGAVRLDGVRLDGVRLDGVRLDGVRLDGVRLDGVRLAGVRLDSVRLNGVRLDGVRLDSVCRRPNTLGNWCDVEPTQVHDQNYF